MRRLLSILFYVSCCGVLSGAEPESLPTTQSVFDSAPPIRQITFGPQHHFFGYIGHAGTVPWNAGGRYLLALRTAFQDHMPHTGDAADIVLLDAQHDYTERVVDQTRAWNFQQGTMMYWNPKSAQTQFFFNDRDPATNKVFTVLFDMSQGPRGRRIREYRFDDTPVGNSGVAQAGGYFMAINYARLARVRPVTGYPETFDWTIGVKRPQDDGVFRIDIETGRKELVISFLRLAELIRPVRPDVDEIDLFINHTLCSRDGRHVLFFCRGDFERNPRKLDILLVMEPDGKNAVMLKGPVGGHPEWADGSRLIGRRGNRQVIYDVDRQAFAGDIGLPDTFRDPGGDVALSPDGRWFVNGSDVDGRNWYTFYQMADGRVLKAGPLERGEWISGDLRIDPAPCWNRTGTAVVATGVAADAAHTRQMFIIAPTGLK